MTHFIPATTSLTRIPTLSDVRVDIQSDDDEYVKCSDNNPDSTSGACPKQHNDMFLYYPRLIANKVWRLVSRETRNDNSHSSDREKYVWTLRSSTPDYVVEWGYFVDPERLWHSSRRQRSYSSTSIVPFLRPIKEINSKFLHDAEGDGAVFASMYQYRLARSILRMLYGSNNSTMAQSIVFASATVFMITLGGYKLLHL